MEQRDGLPDAPARHFGAAARSQHHWGELLEPLHGGKLRQGGSVPNPSPPLQPGDGEQRRGSGLSCRPAPSSSVLLLLAGPVARDRAFAERSPLHAKHAVSLQDPAAFCTALLQRGWGDGFRLPARQWRMESGRTEPSSLGCVPKGMLPPKMTPARAQPRLLRARVLLQHLSSSRFPSCTLILWGCASPGRDVQAQASRCCLPRGFLWVNLFCGCLYFCSPVAPDG